MERRIFRISFSFALSLSILLTVGGCGGGESGLPSGDTTPILTNGGGSSGDLTNGGSNNSGGGTVNPTPNFATNTPAIVGVQPVVQNTTSATSIFVSGGNNTYSAQVGVGFYNGQNISVLSDPIPLPSGCNNPVIVTQAVTNSIACSASGNDSVLGICPHDNSSTSEVMASAYENLDLTAGTFQVFLEAEDGVCVGIPGADPLGTACLGSSPSYKVNIILNCH